MIKKEDELYSMLKNIFYPLLAFMFLGWGYLNFAHPWVNVWQQSMEGQAELAHAEYSRQIATCEALAKKESAKSLADAEVIRAEGVAKANKIIGDSLANNEAYLRYLWIQGMQTNQMQVIYIPTEANLPILESQRFNEYKNCENKIKQSEK